MTSFQQPYCLKLTSAVNVLKQTCVYVHTYAYMCVCVYVHTYMCVYMYITHIHTHTHAHICKNLEKNTFAIRSMRLNNQLIDKCKFFSESLNFLNEKFKKIYMFFLND